MADEIKKEGEELELNEEAYEDVITLTDLESGEEENFILLGEVEMDGCEYMALEPEENPNQEFVILKKVVDEEGNVDLVDIDDDEEFDKVADFFEDQLFNEVDYDADGEN